MRRRSLTTWILVSMVVGAEIGHDFPDVATQLRLLSQIFLRLIKTIIAPLLFATLVVGIAGHANLRQVGRMGVKALIYFEIVTTLALLIGWGAITISRAGDGINAADLRRSRAAAGAGGADVAGHHPAHLPGEHRQAGRRRRGAAARGVQRDVRHGAGA